MQLKLEASFSNTRQPPKERHLEKSLALHCKPDMRDKYINVFIFEVLDLGLGEMLFFGLVSGIVEERENTNTDTHTFPLHAFFKC